MGAGIFEPRVLSDSSLGFKGRLFILYISVALPLAINATAILLAVKIQSFGHSTTIGVAFPEVGIKKIYSLLISHLVTNFKDEVMLLMRADEQGSGESIKALLTRRFSRF